MILNKKIFLVIATLEAGGSERVISQLANSFSKYPRTEVHLILLAEQDDFYVIDEKVNIHRLGFTNNGSLKKISSMLKTSFKLRKLLKNEKPDAVLSFIIKYNILTLFSSVGLSLRVFVSERNNPYRNYGIKLMLLEKLTYGTAAGIIAQTNVAKQVLKKRVKNDNIVSIPNPIKKIKLYPQISRQKIIVNVGRLHSQKGQEYLIRAFAKIKAPEWKLVIIGEGEERFALEQLILNLNLEKKVLLVGIQSNVDEWLAKASIFAFSSLYEGFPNALAEAMAAGLPCVSFDCNTGPREIIENYKNGILVEVKNIARFAKELQHLTDNMKLRMRLGGEAIKIKENLSTKQIAKDYYKFICNKNI